MKLTYVQVKNFRSYVVGQNDSVPGLAVGDGLNLLVGPNNCGKSNLLRAVALALDTKASFAQEVDVPAQLSWAHPTITLSLRCNPNVSVEDTLLRYAKEYEQTATAGATYAAKNELNFRVSYAGSRRDESLLVRGAGNRRGDGKKLEKALGQLRKCARFIYLRSGESLTNFLVGAFRELLHTVLRDHLKSHVRRANRRRDEYINGVVAELLQPLEKHAFTELHEVMAELTQVSIRPYVPKLVETLAKADIVITDTAETALLNKGTGVRGALSVSLLGYLAKNSRRSLIVAVEEPESFLHPRAQQELRNDLAELARRNDLTLLVTTHSPFMLDRSSTTTLTPFHKSADGRTEVGKSIRGDESHVNVVSALFGETLTPTVLEAVEPLRSDARAVLFVEGYTDKCYIDEVVRVAGREDLLEGLEIRFDEGAHKAALQALLLRQMTQKALPMGVLFDWDEPGKGAQNLLLSKYGWHGNLAWTYRKWRMENPAEVPVEAEDMFSGDLLEEFVNSAGKHAVAESAQYKSGTFHYGLTEDAKAWFMEYLKTKLQAKHVTRWIQVLGDIRSQLKVDGSAPHSIETATN